MSEATLGEQAPTGTGQVPAPRAEPGGASLPPAPAAGSPVPARARGLGARERDVLDFEVRTWSSIGKKEEAIWTTFELSPTRYYQILNALLDDVAALAYAPVLVARLRRVRETRRRIRH